MPNDQARPGIQNKKLLIIAVVLAAVVVLIYNWHISQVRKASKGETMYLVSYKRNMSEGEKITAKDIRIVTVPKKLEMGLPDLVVPKDGRRDKAPCNDYNLRTSVRKNQFALWSHVTGDRHDSPSNSLNRGTVALTLSIDQKHSPGATLQVGNRVNVCGLLALGGGAARVYRVIEAVQVLAIGGRADVGGLAGPGRTGRAGMTSYRTISIEVPKDVSLQLQNVLSHVIGGVIVEVRPQKEEVPAVLHINPALKSLAKTAAKRSAER